MTGIIFFIFSFLSIDHRLLTIDCYADTIYYKSNTSLKGLIVEELYDRFVLSTPDGEKEIHKANIEEIFFDEPYQNNLYIGKKFEDEGDFEKALKFYRLSAESNPDFKEAQDAIKGLEDAKWRFKKTWRYLELKDMLQLELGIKLKRSKDKIVIGKLDKSISGHDDLSMGDAIISCWRRPLTCAGLKKAAEILTGPSNTILKVVIERDVEINTISGIKLFPVLVINMDYEGPVVKFVAKKNPAYKAGLREGDLIAKIDGSNTRYMTLDKVKRKIFSGTKRRLLTIHREINLMRRKASSGNAKKAMWVWNSKEILLDEVKRKELLNFCDERNIETLFFQLQYQFQFNRQPSSRPLSEIPAGLFHKAVCCILYEGRLKIFLKDAHSHGIKVYMLDGYPGFCLEPAHYLILAQIKAILNFNKTAAPTERIDGVHYDNEPYLLPAFDSSFKEDIMRQFLRLNQKCKKLIESSRTPLEFGIDIPFWFDQLSRFDTKLIDICDNIGVMDYRNFSAGPDGIVAHVLDELKYAAKAKKKVFVGIETSRYAKGEVYFASMLDKGTLERYFADGKNPALIRGERFEGFALRVQTCGKNIYLGLRKPQGTNEEDFNKALSKLQSEFGPIAAPIGAEEHSKLTFDIIHDLSSNPELRDIQPNEYSAADQKAYLMFVAKEEMLEKLTFADLSERDLNSVLFEAQKDLKNYPSFAGFAVHHYKSYKELCEKK